MKRILMIGTGGTIASGKTAEGLMPELTSEQLLSFVPAVSSLCRAECLQLLSLDSTNLAPTHWLLIAKAIRERYDRYDGFVISHGTDTMAYTAAALSYLIQGARKPIILTGAQKPISFDSTDSKVNLTDAFLCACSDTLHGVMIVFNGKVIQGTRACKTRSKSYEAFSSINYPYLAVLQDGCIILGDLWGNEVYILYEKEGTSSSPEKTGDDLLDWWNGDWYGWWKMTGCSGYYEDMEGDWWDICGNIDIGADKTGVVRLWDEDYSRDSLMAKVNVTLSTAGTGEHGTMTSEDGQFTDIAIEHADWIVDPGLADRDDLICIDGYYENGEDEFYYEIYLRPWGTYWDDADEDSRPKSYDDWYLPLIESGASVPNAIGGSPA